MSHFIRIFYLIKVLSLEKFLGNNFTHVPKIPDQPHAKLWKTGSPGGTPKPFSLHKGCVPTQLNTGIQGGIVFNI